MNLAAIFALLLQSGVCAQSEFQRPDGTALAIMVCPRMATPDSAAPAKPTEPTDPAPEAAPEKPGKHT
jgi:hypothetical protein